MYRPVQRWVVALVGLNATLVALASAAGIALRGDLATTAFTTVRGDVADILDGGIYRFNGEAVAAEGVGWDAVTLFLVVPSLVLALPALSRGSVRAVLLVTGLLAYTLYQYAEYAMFLAYGPLFALYVAISALSVSAIAILLGHLDLGAVAAGVGDRFPRRAATAYGAFVAGLLAMLWLPLIARTWNAAQVPELAGATTLVVQAFDLGFLVALGIFTAITVGRRRPVGYVLAAVLVVKGAAMGAGIVAMLLVEAQVTGVIQLPPIILFAAVSAVSLVLGWRVYANLDVLHPGHGDAARPDGPAALERAVPNG